MLTQNKTETGLPAKAIVAATETTAAAGVAELLLPVGSMDMCLAAIHNGADAVYIGVPQFNARGRSQDFTLEQLQEMMELCHLYGIKVFLACNVLIFERELPRVRDLMRQLLLLGPDAFIVQDLGLARLIRQMNADVPIHGSTQMTITHHAAIALLADLNIQRFVLGREVSLKEMAIIRQNTTAELEVFVHGALCVAYSGQCFTSEGIGGRSANRGQCAQSCRLPYDMYVDGEKKDLGDVRYLVSPQDLCGVDDVPQLVQMGINSFKVEGRLKTPEYVAQAAQSYVKARDQVLSAVQRQELKQKMSITFSRGFFSGWFHGVNHQKLVPGTYSNHRGLLIGEIIQGKDADRRYKMHCSLIKEQIALSAGCGLLLVWQQDGQTQEAGGKIREIEVQGKNVTFSLWESESTKHHFSHTHNSVPVGAQVYLNSHPQLEKQWQQSYQSRHYTKKIPLSMHLTGKLNGPLSLKIDDGVHQVQVHSQETLTCALNAPLRKEKILEILGQLGGTCFQLHEQIIDGAITISIAENLFIHSRQIKELRQKATGELALLRMRPHTIKVSSATDDLLRAQKIKINHEIHESHEKNFHPTQLHVLLRGREQVDHLVQIVDQNPHLRQLLGDIILDFEFGRDYLPSVQLLRSHSFSIGMATTRIFKPQENQNLRMIERVQPDMILVRNLGSLAYFSQQNIQQKFRLHGDFSLNAANSLASAYLLSKGLSTICASYDLSDYQLKDLINHAPAEKIEVTLQQYMPLFHMEHCVFAAFLSEGTSYKDCGRPCEQHRVELRDYYGNRHFLKADAECRNTMFQGTPQSHFPLAIELQKLGVRHFRLEFLEENFSQMQQLLLLYGQHLCGQC